MSKTRGFQGLGVAMVTPFDKSGEIDYPGLQRLTEHLIKGGVDYLVVHGTTGESPVLSKKEKRESIDFILEVNSARVPVVIGIGGNDTRGLVHYVQDFNFDGIDGILSVSPAYSKPTQAGIVRHYQELCSATEVPFILYNVPSRTSSNMEAETTLRLAEEIDHVVAIKEASNDMDQISEIIRRRPDGFQVVSGDDAITLALIANGADGLISVVGNAFIEETSALVRNGLSGNMEEARRSHHALIDLIELLFVDGNPAGIKEVLQILGICHSHLRLPLVNCRKETVEKIKKVLKTRELVDHSIH